jgi:hypothetical protein
MSNPTGLARPAQERALPKAPAPQANSVSSNRLSVEAGKVFG